VINKIKASRKRNIEVVHKYCNPNGVSIITSPTGNITNSNTVKIFKSKTVLSFR